MQIIQFCGIIFTPTKETKMSLADTLDYQNRIHEISFRFAQDMLELHREEPEIFEGRTTLAEWSNQAWMAKIDLDKRIEEQIEIVEGLLHDGSYISNP
jgi:hypothetical protein